MLVLCCTSPRVNISSLGTHTFGSSVFIITHRRIEWVFYLPAKRRNKDVNPRRHRKPARLSHRNTDRTFHHRHHLPTTPFTPHSTVLNHRLDRTKESTIFSFVPSPRNVHQAFAFRAFKYAVSLEATARCTSASLFGHSSHTTGYHCSDL
jgi:hypothetical protein